VSFRTAPLHPGDEFEKDHILKREIAPLQQATCGRGANRRPERWEGGLGSRDQGGARGGEKKSRNKSFA